MSKIAQRVAAQWLRKCAAPAALRMVLQELANLQELSDNLTDIEDQVAQTFKMATIDPEVKSQMAVLIKARTGLKQAQATGQSIAEILKHYPEDKTALRAAKDAAVMIARFKKHETEAYKIIARLSKKEMPPALKKMSESLARMLQAHLTNPKVLQVTTWQQEDTSYSTRQEGVVYFTLFRVPSEDHNNQLFGVGLKESTLKPGVYTVSVSYGSYSLPTGNDNPTTAKAEVARFLEALKGSPLLKGEEDRTQVRVQRAKQLFDDIKSVWRSLYRGDAEADLDSKGLKMEFESRPLSRRDNDYMSENDHDEEYEKELARILPKLKPLLTDPAIKGYTFDDGEKGHLRLLVTMK